MKQIKLTTNEFKNVPHQKCFLSASGANGELLSFELNGERVLSTFCSGMADISGKLLASNSLCVCSPSENISMSLFVCEKLVYVLPNSWSFDTVIKGGEAFVTIKTTVVNEDSRHQKFNLVFSILNHKNKRVAIKSKKVIMQKGTAKEFEMVLKIKKPQDMPYFYNARIAIDDEETLIPLGIAKNPPKKLYGVCVEPEVEFLNSSTYLAKKFALIKECGFNAVRFLSLPTERELDELMKAGLYCIVDAFEFLAQENPVFNYKYEDRLDSLKKIASHPSIVAFNIAGLASETYGRGGGAKLIENIYDDLKVISSKTVLLNFTELDLIKAEKEKLSSIKCSVFKSLTKDSMEVVDAIGFSGAEQNALHNEFRDTEKDIFGLSVFENEFFDVHSKMQSSFSVKGIFLESSSLLFDSTLTKKPYFNLAQIILKKDNTSLIATVCPDSGEISSAWHYERHLGQPIKVMVYSRGDIVQLRLNDRTINRVIGGRLNSFSAEFVVDYQSGTLSATSYRKGSRIADHEIKTPSNPTSLSLSPYSKKSKEGELVFVEMTVLDKEGNFATHARRDITFEVCENAEIVTLFNSIEEVQNFDKKHFVTISSHGGKIIAVLKPKNLGKITISAKGEKLRGGRTSVTVN
ncbi:MAG: DUF4982 domain-containing protein [Firmicutes bacterium]|nr:DUF4982 domain-containing protein [Bacillota bacterium]MCL2255932.1 DUF4982 domain-containing protein [Bacillota bacterium]